MTDLTEKLDIEIKDYKGQKTNDSYSYDENVIN